MLVMQMWLFIPICLHIIQKIKVALLIPIQDLE